jgi:uncharacterized alkaline shock family protein YloU
VNLFDRFILTLYSLALVVVSLFVMATSLNLISYEYVMAIIEEMYSSSRTSLIYFAAAAIFFLISVKFLFTSLRGAGRQPAPPAVRSTTEYGDVRITIDTLESLAAHAAKKVRGIRDLKAKVRPEENGTSVHIKVTVDGDTPIPVLVEQVQQGVKQHVESIAGVVISEVTVLVSEVAQANTGTRVRRVE